METCWSCGMPQPDSYEESLHYEGCVEHDEDTCLACNVVPKENEDD